jgi:hypothetical protein
MRIVFALLLTLAALLSIPSLALAAELTGIYATPCPLNLSSPPAACTFTGVPEGSKIKIYDMAGRTVKELDGIVWDGRNSDGELVSSGTYIFRVTAPDGSKFTGKLAIVK